jgi:hypothetical protein
VTKLHVGIKLRLYPYSRPLEYINGNINLLFICCKELKEKKITTAGECIHRLVVFLKETKRRKAEDSALYLNIHASVYTAQNIRGQNFY